MRLKRLNTGIVIENFDKPKFSVHYPNQKFLDYSACFKKLKINNILNK